MAVNMNVTNNTSFTVNATIILLTYVPLHVSNLIGSSSGVVIYTFSLLNCKVGIHIYRHRLKMTTFYVHLHSNC
jgi:hypothetical protein